MANEIYRRAFQGRHPVLQSDFEGNQLMLAYSRRHLRPIFADPEWSSKDVNSHGYEGTCWLGDVQLPAGMDLHVDVPTPIPPPKLGSYKVYRLTPAPKHRIVNFAGEPVLELTDGVVSVVQGRIVYGVRDAHMVYEALELDVGQRRMARYVLGQYHDPDGLPYSEQVQIADRLLEHLDEGWSEWVS